MAVVPIRTDTPQPAQRLLPPPPPVFALMAAVQMHREGKLLAPGSTPTATPEPTQAPPNG